jgi:hypothetical protein
LETVLGSFFAAQTKYDVFIKFSKLFPIRLTEYATLKKWECLDSATGAASAFVCFGATSWRKPTAKITSPISRIGSPPPPLPAPSPVWKKI